MRNILCPLCEHDHTSLVAQRRERGLTFATVACRDCGLVYHNPVIEDQDRFELAVSHRQWHTGEATGFARQLRKQEKRWNLQWPMIQPVFTPGCRVLEVGCGLGPGRGPAQRPGGPGVGRGARSRAGCLCQGAPRPDGFLRPFRGDGPGQRPPST